MKTRLTGKSFLSFLKIANPKDARTYIHFPLIFRDGTLFSTDGYTLARIGNDNTWFNDDVIKPTWNIITAQFQTCLKENIKTTDFIEYDLDTTILYIYDKNQNLKCQFNLRDGTFKSAYSEEFAKVASTEANFAIPNVHDVCNVTKSDETSIINPVLIAEAIEMFDTNPSNAKYRKFIGCKGVSISNFTGGIKMTRTDNEIEVLICKLVISE